MPRFPDTTITTVVCRFTIWALLVGAIATACGAHPDTDVSVGPDLTVVVADPTSTPQTAVTPGPTPSLDSPPRASAVTLADGRTTSILRNGPRDFIPAIFDPIHIAADQIADQVGDFSPVIGVSIGEESVAYSVAHLSSHEVVNDTVGGAPIAVTW